MSSEFRDGFRRDLDEIPLPPEADWTRPRARARSRGFGAAVAVLVALVVVLGSLGAGQLVRAIRAAIESQRAASSAFVRGDDLVYLAEGDPATQRMMVILPMPGGTEFRLLAGDTYVGTEHEGDLMRITGDWAYLPVARAAATGPDVYDTYLQQVDLRRGIQAGRIPTGSVTVTRELRDELPGTPIFPAATAVGGDNASVWLVRDTGAHGLTTLVDRFDGQTLAPLAHLVLSSSGDGAVRSQVVALGNDRVAVIRQHFVNQNRIAEDWYFLDGRLNVIASYADDYATRLPAGGLCSIDVKADPARAGWLILCSDPSLTANGALIFLDPERFSIEATVPLQRELGYALGMTTTSEGVVSVLTNRPAIARIDSRNHQTIDARPVTAARSWFEQLVPPIAAAKGAGGPSVVFSPDGRYAYLASSPDRWWGSLARIDLRDAKVVTSRMALGAVAALALSPGGERLYALAVDDRDEHTLLLLEPQTLAVASRTSVGTGPFAIAAVRQRTTGP